MTDIMAKWFPWVLLAPAVIPLIYIDGFLYPFVAPKTFLFRGLGIVVLASLVFLALSRSPLFWGRLKQKVTWIPAALLLVAYATSLIGIDFYRSFWSVFDRGDGLLTLTVAVFFFYGTLLSADRTFLRRIFTVVAWVATAVAGYVVLQWFGDVSGIHFAFVAETKGRIGGTLGNAAFLAAYLGMTVWAPLAIAGGSRGFWKKAYYSGAVLQFLAIVLAATRGTMLALLIVGFFTLLYFAWKGEGRMRMGARAGIVGLFIFAGLFFSFREQLKHASFEPVRRVASISLTDATVSSRLFVWQHVFAEALKQPLTGYGAEHIEMIFDRVYDPAAIIEQWFDRTHNAFLDYFVQFGVLGVLLYSGLIGSLGYVGLALFRRGDRYGVFLLLLACTYAVQNFFVFDTAMTLWLLLATLAAAYAYESSAAPSASRFSLPKPVVLAVAGIILALLYPVVIQPARANLYLANGYRDHVTDVHRAIASFQKGLSLNTYADIEYGYQAYSMYTDHQQTMLAGAERVAAYHYALETLTANFERYPYDARTAIYLAHVLDSAPPEEVVDETFLRAVLTRAIELSPKRIQPHYIMSNIALKKGDKATDPAQRNRYYREALTLLEEYAAKVPDLAEPRFIIASLYIVVGDRVSAKHWADEGLPLYKGGSDTARRAVRYYLAVEDWVNVRRFLADIVAEDPEDYPTMYDLAKAEFLTGNKEKALEIVAILREKSPGLVETDTAFLKAIGE